jgi:hypothetical protein
VVDFCVDFSSDKAILTIISAISEEKLTQYDGKSAKKTLRFSFARGLFCPWQTVPNGSINDQYNEARIAYYARPVGGSGRRATIVTSPPTSTATALSASAVAVSSAISAFAPLCGWICNRKPLIKKAGNHVHIIIPVETRQHCHDLSRSRRIGFGVTHLIQRRAKKRIKKYNYLAMCNFNSHLNTIKITFFWLW